MIRILLPLAVVVAAYFGPWMIDQTGDIFDGRFAPSSLVYGQDLVAQGVDCLMEGRIDFGEACRPDTGTLGTLLWATMVICVLAAVVGIAGLLPLVGRLTSLLTIVAGAAGLVTFGWFAKDIMSAEGASFGDLRWGAYTAGVFSLLTLFAGFGGLDGDAD